MYVNDIITARSDIHERESLKQCLIKEFELKQLGNMAHSKLGFFISHQKYVINLFTETGKLACKLAHTLIDLNLKHGEATEDPAVDKEVHHRLIGTLISHIQNLAYYML